MSQAGVLAVTAPIYLLIAAGYASVRLGLFEKADMRVLGKYVIHLALPALLFNALSQRSLGEVIQPVFLVAYAVGSLGALGLGLLWGRRAGGQGLSKSAVMAMGMSCCNSGFIGFPLASQAVGPATAGICLALAMLVENLILIPLALGLADSDTGEAAAGSRGRRIAEAARRTLRGLVRNPLIYGIVAGVAFAIPGWHLPEPMARAVGLVAGSCSALALFVIGGSLVGIRVGSMLRDVSVVTAGKLLVHPLLVLLLVMLLPPMAREFQVAVVLMSAVPMMGIYAVLAQRHGHEGFASAALLATTVASFFTLTGLLWVLGVGR